MTENNQDNPAQETTEEYEARMAAKADEHQAKVAAELNGENPENNSSDATLPSETNSEVPNYIPEKFRNAEDPVKALAEAHAELEKKLGTQGTDNSEEAGTGDEASENETENTDKAAEEAAAKAGFTIEELQNEYDTNGKLTDASYEKLESAGIPKSIVDNYIELQQVAAEAHHNDMMASVGGEQNFQSMIGWMGTNLTPDEVTAYNDTIENAKSPAQVKLAITNMYARFSAENGQKEPTLVKGETGTMGSSGGYQSRAEITRDMRDPRYRTDPAYRTLVQQKLAKTNDF